MRRASKVLQSSFTKLRAAYQRARGRATLTLCWEGAFRKFAADTLDHQPLEQYYEANKMNDAADVPDSPAESPSSLRYRPSSRYKPPFDRLDNRTRARSISDTTAVLALPGQTLSPYHPALSLPEFVDTFGPLVFPLYRAALCRQRILLIAGAPVELSCNYGTRLSP